MGCTPPIDGERDVRLRVGDQILNAVLTNELLRDGGRLDDACHEFADAIGANRDRVVEWAEAAMEANRDSYAKAWARENGRIVIRPQSK